MINNMDLVEEIIQRVAQLKRVAPVEADDILTAILGITRKTDDK